VKKLNALKYLRLAARRHFRELPKDQWAVLHEGVLAGSVVLAAAAWVIWQGHMPDWKLTTILTNLLPVACLLGGSVILIVYSAASKLLDVWREADRIAAIRGNDR